MVRMSTKFHLNWTKLASTSFVNVQLDQKCNVEASLACYWWNWLKICVLGLFGMVHMCKKIHGHWTHIASTCFTMWPTGQKLKHDNALTWVMVFGFNMVWWSYMLVGSCSTSFKANGVPYQA